MTLSALQSPDSVVLVLPLPPSPNRWARHPMALHTQKKRYQGKAWVAAFSQTRPSASPPEKVDVRATLYLCRLRDADGAVGSMKFALDALRQNQTGSLSWRKSIAPTWGYFVDDDPERLTLTVQQVKVSKRAEERLVLEVVPFSERRSA